MTDFEDFHNRISKRLIAATFAVAMLLDFMPFSSDGFFWLPEFTALMLLYWAINRPQSVGVGTAFVVGMLTDIGTAAPLGQHALSYMLITFLMQQRQRQIILLPFYIADVLMNSSVFSRVQDNARYRIRTCEPLREQILSLLPLSSRLI